MHAIIDEKHIRIVDEGTGVDVTIGAQTGTSDWRQIARGFVAHDVALSGRDVSDVYDALVVFDRTFCKGVAWLREKGA